MTDKKEVKQEIKLEARKQSKRKPFGSPRLKLEVSQKLEGFYYRWVNDVPGRIAQAQEGDYAFAEPAEVGREDLDGGRVKELVGSHKDGSAMYAYLMRIPMEYYEQDQAAKTAHLDDIDNALKGGKSDHTIGKSGYVPESGISIK